MDTTVLGYRVRRSLRRAPHLILRHWPPLIYVPGFIVMAVWAGLATVFPKWIAVTDSAIFDRVGEASAAAFVLHVAWMFVLHSIMGVPETAPVISYPSLVTTSEFGKS